MLLVLSAPGTMSCHQHTMQDNPLPTLDRSWPTCPQETTCTGGTNGDPPALRRLTCDTPVWPAGGDLQTVYYPNATYRFQASSNTSGVAVNGSQFQCMLESYNQSGSMYTTVQPAAVCTSPTVGTCCRANMLLPNITALHA